MSPEPIQAESHGEGFPRVSGDEPDVWEVRVNPFQFSPREWG